MSSFRLQKLPQACGGAELYAQRSERSDTSIADSLYCHGPAADLPPHMIIRTVEFHLLFFVSFVTMGAALSLLDNYPQLLRSMAPSALPATSGPSLIHI